MVELQRTVREQPAEPVSGLCVVAADGVSCSVVAEEHRRIYHGGLPPVQEQPAEPAEPDEEDQHGLPRTLEMLVNDLMDEAFTDGEMGGTRDEMSVHSEATRNLRDEILARWPALPAEPQQAWESYQGGVAAGQRDEDRDDEHDGKARRLYDRIAALVPQQPVQARGVDGEPLWQHASCGNTVSWKDGPPPDWACDMDTGPWRPLLVAAPDSDRTPEVLPTDAELDVQIGEVTRERDEARAELDLTSRELSGTQEALIRYHRERDEARTAHARAQADAEHWQEVAETQASLSRPDPLVLRLPEVPEGTQAFVGKMTKNRYVMRGGRWCFGTSAWTFAELLGHEGELQVELAAPRTWPKLAELTEDIKTVRGASGTVYHQSHFAQSIPVFCRHDPDGRPLSPGYPFHALQTFDGPLTEVPDREAGQ